MKILNKNKKTVIISMLAALSLSILGGVCFTNHIQASAQSTVVIDTVPSASVRVAEITSSGIRFAAKLNGYTPESANENVKYGMLIVPYEMVEGMSGDYIAELEDAYPTVEFAYDYCTPYQAGQTISSFNDTESYYIVSSLVSLNTGNYTRDFVAISYTEVEGVKTYVTDWEECKRNIAQVANGVYDDYDPADEDDQKIIATLDAFLDKGLTEQGYTPETYQVPVTSSSFTLEVGEETQFIEDSNKMHLVYSVADEQVAKVEDGKLIGVGVGQTTLNVRYGKYTVECTVTVNDASLIWSAQMALASEKLSYKQNISKAEFVTDAERGKVLSLEYNKNNFPQMTISTATDLSRVESLSYYIKIVETGTENEGAGFLPNVPGSAQSRADGYAITQNFIEKSNLAIADGWQKITITGLNGTNTKAPGTTGKITKDMPTISYDSTTGLYTIWLAWIGRDSNSISTNYTIYMDDFRVENCLPEVNDNLINNLDSTTGVKVGKTSAVTDTVLDNTSDNTSMRTIVEDDERGSVLQISATANIFPCIKVTTDIDLSAYTSKENTFAISYWVKVTSEGDGLFFLPAVAGCTGNRGDQCTTTNTLLGKTNLTAEDGWKQVTISGLYIGVNFSNKNGTYNGVVDNGDGTYSIYLYYISRSTSSTGIASTILMDDIELVK